MLTTGQLISLMNAHESDRVELTMSTNNTDKFCEAICAFANDFPNHRQYGYLLVGVDDNGNPGGLTVTDQLLRRLGDLRSNVNLEPLPAMTVQKYSLPQGDVAAVEVAPSDLPPVRYKGRVWIRIGPSRRGANQQEERILVERRGALQKPFDLRPCLDCSFDDLVPGLFLASYLPAAVDREVIEENRREVREQMASLRLYDMDADCPTNGAVLLFGKDPLRWIPGAWVQFVRWAGDSMSADVTEDKRFSGDLVNVLRDLDALVAAQIQGRPVPESTLRERTDADYPAVAIRELLLNGIMHRSYESNAPVHFYWYEDRIEIQNPGGLYGMATPENFPARTDYRNPVVSEAMATLGYVNRFGRGVIRAREALAHNGNPAPEFELDDPTGVVAVIRRET
ncbi:MAG: putative DNA binding domain-containing protein [Gammaproteobacteria bacterium]|nr:putative DNA binding domain-containing protein [Gammaproteobacteria bacterium]